MRLGPNPFANSQTFTLQVLEARIDHARVVSILRKADHLPLVKDYLLAVQKSNLLAVNDAVNELLIEEEDFKVCGGACWGHSVLSLACVAATVHGEQNGNRPAKRGVSGLNCAPSTYSPMADCAPSTYSLVADCGSTTPRQPRVERGRQHLCVLSCPEAAMGEASATTSFWQTNIVRCR